MEMEARRWYRTRDELGEKVYYIRAELLHRINPIKFDYIYEKIKTSINNTIHKKIFNTM
jgi:2-polyprenyl-3-methyl-5-hydroxy-6-metoxy-1,4-benzoquinol methylase